VIVSIGCIVRRHNWIRPAGWLTRVPASAIRCAGSLKNTQRAYRQIVRDIMVILIGLVTMSALVWLLAWSLMGESDAEHRHREELKGSSGPSIAPEAAVPFRRAA